MHPLKLDSPGRRKIKYCPCNKDNRDGKFTPFAGYETFGYCHSCDKTFPPPKESEFKTPFPMLRKLEKMPRLAVSTIPTSLVKANVVDGLNANLIKWLSCELRREKGEVPFSLRTVEDVVKRYKIRGSNVYRGGVAFIYCDIDFNVRQIKIMGYNSLTGKRVKEPFPEIAQIGKKLLEGIGKNDINIVPCFFGEHLLAGNSKEVYLFESEATAIYASVFFPDAICLATGGKNGCRWDSPNHYKFLNGRRVTLWPDIDAHDEWTLKAKALKNAGIEMQISTKIVVAARQLSTASGIPYAEYKALKFDLRDILVYKDPVASKHLHSEISHEVNISHGVPSTELPEAEPLTFEKSITGLKVFEPPEKFDPQEYWKWFESIPLPSHPIYINPGLTVYNAASFVTGRLNHIKAFTGHREQGNRSSFIYQLQQFRKQVEQ